MKINKLETNKDGLKVCPKCGKSSFRVTEVYKWEAEIDKDGDINCNCPDSSVESVECSHCGTKIKFDGNTNFNFS